MKYNRSVVHEETMLGIVMTIEDEVGQLYFRVDGEGIRDEVKIESLDQGLQLLNRIRPPEVVISRAVLMATIQTAVLAGPSFVLAPLLDGWQFAAAIIPISAGYLFAMDRVKRTDWFCAWLRKVPVSRYRKATGRTLPVSCGTGSIPPGQFVGRDLP